MIIYLEKYVYLKIILCHLYLGELRDGTYPVFQGWRQMLPWLFPPEQGDTKFYDKNFRGERKLLAAASPTGSTF